jgi:hypothetical protein
MLDPRVKAESFPTIMVGSKADIRLSPAERDMYSQAIEDNDKISVQRRTHLHRYFTQFCENDEYHRRLNEEQFKREGKFPDGRSGNATNVSIWTFKAWQWRVYGSILQIQGKRCFVGVRVDPSKKQKTRQGEQ